MLTDQLLGLLKLVLLIALYLFFARVLWAVWHEVRTPAVSRAVVADAPVVAPPVVAPPVERSKVSRPHRVTRLVVIAPAELKGTELALHGEILIGRAPECSLRLADDTGASARHATVRFVDGIATIEDLHSTNGTRVNGVGITSPTGLVVGDRIDIGVITIEVRR